MAYPFSAGTAGSGAVGAAFALTAGRTVFVGVRWLGTGAYVLRIEDTAGNVYTRIAGKRKVGTLQADVWYCRNALGHATNVVTITFSGAATTVYHNIGQWANLSIDGPLDAYVVGSDSGGVDVISPAFSTRRASELVAAFGTVNAAAGTYTCTGFTSRQLDADHITVWLDKTVTALQAGATVELACSAGTAMILIVITAAADQLDEFIVTAGVTAASAGSATSLAAPQFHAVAGQLLVVGISWQDDGTGIAVLTVTDTAGNSYARIPPGVANVNVTDRSLEEWCAPSALAHAANIVTVTWSKTTTKRAVSVGQWASPAGAAIYAAEAPGNALAALSVTSDPFSTTTSRGLLVAYLTTNGATPVFTCTGFVQRTGEIDAGEDTWCQDVLADKIVQAALTDETVTGSGDTGTSIQLVVGAFVIPPPSPPVGHEPPIRRIRRFPLPFDRSFWMFIDRMEFLIQAGVGTPTGQGAAPLLEVRFSGDGGETWGNTIFLSAGLTGERNLRLVISQVGRLRNGYCEVAMSDPVLWYLLASYVDAIEGGV